MRAIRLLSIALTILTVGLLSGPVAAAEPPVDLSGQLTDNAHLLDDAGSAQVQGAIDKLYAERRVRLWVVYVSNFASQSPQDWGRDTVRRNDFGDRDALLAVAADHRYVFWVGSGIGNVSKSQLDDLRYNQIEPALGRGDWSGAAVVAANGLNRAPSSPSVVPLLIALGGVATAVAILLLVMRRRANRRRAAQLAAAHEVDPTDPEALAAVPLRALDELSRSKVVNVDNAVRTSSNELELAIEEFGVARTEPFSRAVDNAKAALTKAFAVRHQLEDAIPETPAQRRELLTGVIVAAAKADRELEAQRGAFEELRDLVINAPARLDGLTQQLVELTARVPNSEQRLAELRHEFDEAALTSVSGNVTTAQRRLPFADENITRARKLTSKAVNQSDLVDAVRAAESALGQARALLDAVDSAAGDIRHAVATLPAAITDIEAGIAQAETQLQRPGPHAQELTAARIAAVKAATAARGSADPLGAFTRLTKADAELDKLLETVAEEQAAAERLARVLEQAMFAAASRVRAVSDYIDTRRGSIGPEARTRLAEARRQLDAAQGTQSTDVSAAIMHANSAATLAGQAQSLANNDVQATQRAYAGRYGGGNDFGAMMGGIIIGNILGGSAGGGFGGGFGGGSGGWSPTSFGGSGSSGGGYIGGGRF